MRNIWQNMTPPASQAQKPQPVVTIGPDIERAKAMALAHRQNQLQFRPTGYDNLSGPGFMVQGLAEVLTKNHERNQQTALNEQQRAAMIKGGFSESDADLYASGGQAERQMILARRNSEEDAARRFKNDKELAAMRIAAQIEIENKKLAQKGITDQYIHKVVTGKDGYQKVVRIRKADGMQENVPISGEARQAAEVAQTTQNTPGAVPTAEVTPDGEEKINWSLSPDAPLAGPKDVPDEVRNSKKFREENQKAWSKFVTEKPAEAQRMYQALDNFRAKNKLTFEFIDDSIKIVEQAKGKDGTWSAYVPNVTLGWGGALLDMMGLRPGTARADLFANIQQSIRGRLGFQELAEMRESSKTGGAVGQLTEQERQVIEGIIGNISIDQRPQTLLKNLKLVRQYLKDTDSRLTRYFEMNTGYKPRKYEDLTLGRTPPKKDEGAEGRDLGDGWSR